MHHLLIRLTKHIMLHRIRDEIGLLVIRLPIEHNALSGILWNILLYWILVSIVIVRIVLDESLCCRPIISSVRWHPLYSLLVKKAILVLGWLIIIKFLRLVLFTTTIR